MKSKLSAALAAAGCALAVSVGAANADTITTFDVSATFFNGGLGWTPCAGCSLGGTITINTTTGQLVSENITMIGQSVGPFTNYVGGRGRQSVSLSTIQ